MHLRLRRPCVRDKSHPKKAMLEKIDWLQGSMLQSRAFTIS